jgi:hypothetical protein
MDFKQFYFDIVTFNDYIEFRIMHIKKKYMISEWAKDVADVERIINKYDNNGYNIYYGINTKKVKGKKDKNVDFRRLFYFDIEKIGEKPELTNMEYKNKLLKTVDYISESLYNKYEIKPLCLITSGRGMHLYYGIKQGLNREEYDKKFKVWFKSIQLELDKNKPFNDIKFLDSVFNISRISSAPGTHNNKYPEKPLREILYTNISNFIDISKFIDILKKVEIKHIIKDTEVISSGKKRIWNEQNIFESPEFKVFELKVPDTGGYEINNKLRLALNLLMKKYAINNKEEVAERIHQLGYVNKPFDNIEDNEYVYSTAILINWVLTHWEFCLEKNFIIPYPITRVKQNILIIMK